MHLGEALALGGLTRIPVVGKVWRHIDENVIEIEQTAAEFRSECRNQPTLKLTLTILCYADKTWTVVIIYLSIYLKSQDYGDVGAEAQQGRLTM